MPKMTEQGSIGWAERRLSCRGGAACTFAAGTTPHALFTLLYFFPLFLVEISSFAMLTFSPFMKVSRLTLFLLAGMFFAFAVWAVFGIPF